MRLKKILLNILGLTVSSTLLVGLLYLASEKINHSPNGFIRLFPPHALIYDKILDLEYNSFYIAGVSDDHIYLGNPTAPSRMLITNHAFTDTQHVKLQIKDLHLLGAPRLEVDSPYFYIMDGVVPAILRGTLDRLEAKPIKAKSYYTASVPLSKNSFALRSYSKKAEQYILIKKNYADTLRSIYAPELLKKQVDGIFCTDGMLLFNPDVARILYVYYYRNQFVCVDTNMHIQYQGRTIDTTSHARIKVDTMSAKKDNARVVSLSGPPHTVNKHSCISDQWLFIHSALRANNEDKKTFNKCSVIDVYSLKDGTYRSSFYLPDFRDKKIRSFKVHKKTLVALYDNYLHLYHLNF